MSATSTTTSSPLQGTPVHTRSNTLHRFGKRYEDRGAVLRRLADEMIPYFVGPMPPQEFLDTFLPISSDSSPTPSTSDVVLKPGMLSPLGQTSAEAGMYDVFVRPDPRPSPPF
jgi:hypothetical protein